MLKWLGSRFIKQEFELDLTSSQFYLSQGLSGKEILIRFLFLFCSFSPGITFFEILFTHRSLLLSQANLCVKLLVIFRVLAYAKSPVEFPSKFKRKRHC